MYQAALRRKSRIRGVKALKCAAAMLPMILTAAHAFGFDPNATKFTVGIIPDPQYYTVVQWKTDQYLNTQMNWLVSNASSNNLAFVFGMGDNVQDGDPFTTNADGSIGTGYSYNITPSGQATQVTGAPSIDTVDPTNHNFEEEWVRVSNAWNILGNAGIPYYTIAGNHDYYHWDQKKNPNEFLKYFGPQRYAGDSWFGGSSPVNTSTSSAVKSYAGLDTYSFFNAGGYRFMNLALQFDPDAGDMAWAQSIINANPGVPIILDTHDYLSPTGRTAAGTALWNGLINSNPQIFMVLAGHVNGTRNDVVTDASGQQVVEILTDYQDDGFGTSKGFNENYANGGGVMRTLTFDTNADTITASTFSPYINSQGGNGNLANYSGTGANADSFTINFDFAQRLGPPPLAIGKNIYWNPAFNYSGLGSGGSGTWDASTSDSWYPTGSGANSPWSAAGASDIAVFGGNAGGTVTVSGSVSASHLLFSTSGYTLQGGTITLTGAATIDTTAAPATINSVIAGTSGLFDKGGQLTLGGANTFTGGISIDNGGTLSITADNNLGASTNGILMDGGTISYPGGSASLTLTTRVFTMSTGGGTFDTPNPGTSPSNSKLIINHTNGITGSGTITKTGPGWLTIYGNGNNATGDWTINGGVVECAPATGLGSGSVTINSGGELSVNGMRPIANSITLNTGGTLSSDNTSMVTSSFTGAITAGGNFNVRLGNFWSTTSQNLTLSGNITGSGAMTIIPAAGASSSAGKLTLSGDNSQFTGGVVIPTGTLAVGPTAGKPLGTGAVTLSGGKLALQGQAVPTGGGAALAAVNVSGFTLDTIYGAPDSPGTTTTPMDGYFSFFQNGYVPDELSKNAGQSLAGGLASNQITSSITNSVTHTQTPFVLASFADLNTLQLTRGATGTLTLSTPASFTSLAVLATATYGKDDTPQLTLNFADGTSVNTTYDAFDWSIASDPLRQAASAFGTAGLARYSTTQSPGLDNTKPFTMYETDIDLTNINGVDYSDKQLTSLTFTGANGDGLAHALTDIFAVSGSARAWIASSSQNYNNAVNVTANSWIDVSGALSASLGNLNINNAALSVTSADTTSSPYSLNFGATSLTGMANIDVAQSAGGGNGTVQLGVISGSGSLTKTNAGTLQLAGGGSVIGGSLALNGGTLAVTGNTSILGAFTGNSTGTLNIAGAQLSLAPHVSGAQAVTTNLAALSFGAAGKLDLADNNLVINYGTGPDPITQIVAALTAGYDAGQWDGNGGANGAIFTSSAASELGTTLGYRDVDNQIEIKFTWLGDLNFDGHVDGSDLQMLETGAAKPAGSTLYWTDGDLNYDGKINADDFALFALGEARQDGSISAGVPEPTEWGLLLVAPLALRRRR